MENHKCTIVDHKCAFCARVLHVLQHQRQLSPISESHTHTQLSALFTQAHTNCMRTSCFRLRVDETKKCR